MQELLIAYATRIGVRACAGADSTLCDANQIASIVEQYARSSLLRSEMSTLLSGEQTWENVITNIGRLGTLLCATALREIHGEKWQPAIQRLLCQDPLLAAMPIADSAIDAVAKFARSEYRTVPLLPSARSVVYQLFHDNVQLTSSATSDASASKKCELLLHFTEAMQPYATFEEWVAHIDGLCVWSLSEIIAYYSQITEPFGAVLDRCYLACFALDREAAWTLSTCLSTATRSPESGRLYFSAARVLLAPVYAQYCAFFRSPDAAEKKAQIRWLANQALRRTAMNADMTFTLHSGIDRYLAAYHRPRSVLQPDAVCELRAAAMQERIAHALVVLETGGERHLRAVTAYANATSRLHIALWKMEMMDNDILHMMTAVLLDARAIEHTLGREKEASEESGTLGL
jgi:uncharacterized membrane protein YecN with MAPEG domain